MTEILINSILEIQKFRFMSFGNVYLFKLCYVQTNYSFIDSFECSNWWWQHEKQKQFSEFLANRMTKTNYVISFKWRKYDLFSVFTFRIEYIIQYSRREVNTKLSSIPNSIHCRKCKCINLYIQGLDIQKMCMYIYIYAYTVHPM